jgi:DNA-binding response OmpR family regulator
MPEDESLTLDDAYKLAGLVDAGRPLLLLDTDLFFVVKVTDTLKHAGYTVRTVKTEADFARALGERQPALALVNTAARGVDGIAAIAAARAAGVAVIAFGSHVDLATQEAARQAGATTVIANAQVARDLAGVVTRTLWRAARTPPGGPAK